MGSGLRAPRIGVGGSEGWGMGSGMRAQEWDWGWSRVAEGPWLRAGAGAAGARTAAAPGGDQAGSAQSARRPRLPGRRR